ncbi:hypothetical protein M422DRAFT_243769 [Sphaerobolus stellatus SS14]|nr:hypothetical protein M422DRAFT_243769 [Sphaerobolus stellatus SS14]
MSCHIVEWTLQQWQETGEVGKTGPGKNGKQARVMDSEELEFLVALPEQNPDLYLDELQERLA